MKSLTIKENEGHGRFDGIKKGPTLSNMTVCRFKFPKFPLDKTTLILGMPKDTDDDIVKVRKKDLQKISKYLIRQTYTNEKMEDLDSWKNLKDMDFWEFIYEVGMFDSNKLLDD